MTHSSPARLPRLLAAALSVALLAGFIGLRPTPAQAAVTFDVNSTTDAVDAAPGNGLCATAAGECTLRAAIQETNALNGADTINVPPGTYQLTIPGAVEDFAAKNDLDIRDHLTINGAGAAATILDGNGGVITSTVVHIALVKNVIVNNLTIRNGANALYGGGVLNQGNLTLNGVVVTGNSAQQGGGIQSFGNNLILVDSTVSDNTASGYGGGISNTGTVRVVNSTISGNTATQRGGGISSSHPNEPVVTLINTTLSSNHALDDGGGLYNGEGTMHLYNVTVHNNWADHDRDGGGTGGGIRNLNGTVTVRNSIIAYNYRGHPVQISLQDCAGDVISYDYNLIYKPTAACDLIGDIDHNLMDVLPSLGPLAYNGGPTQTHALLEGSPAIDHGHPWACVDDLNPLATDQRGFGRAPINVETAGNFCDIGAVEYIDTQFVYLPLVLR